MITSNVLQRVGMAVGPSVGWRRLASAYNKPRRFYKDVSVVSTSDNVSSSYEVCLDGRKVKTPKGTPLVVKNELLANAIANEWDFQGEKIELDQMHLTTLGFTAQDNPLNKTAEGLKSDILKVLESDTLLYTAEEGSFLADYQKQNWDPLVRWINDRYELDLYGTSSLMGPELSNSTIQRLDRYLSGYNRTALVGYWYAVDSLKTLVAALATVEHFISAEEAVKLALLEQVWQARVFGTLWEHDVDYYHTLSRLSAGVLFAQLNSITESKTVKKATAANSL